MGFVFASEYVVNYVYRLVYYVESALHPWYKACLITMNKLFDVLLQSVCWYFIKDFCIYAHHGYWPEVFFYLFIYLIVFFNYIFRFWGTCEEHAR